MTSSLSCQVQLHLLMASFLLRGAKDVPSDPSDGGIVGSGGSDVVGAVGPSGVFWGKLYQGHAQVGWLYVIGSDIVTRLSPTYLVSGMMNKRLERACTG